jgi:D-3-phosphoglycerate dehydrogenase
MRVLASDPYVSAQTAANVGVELVALDQLLAESDYISLHVAKTPETLKMLNAAAFARMKDGARIINCARGELIDQAALSEVLVSGKLAGAGLDVFDPEPPAAGEALLAAPNLIATPHIAGSTEEAQEIVGIRIVEQMAEYLNNGIAINAVNMPAITPEQYRAIGPYITLAERLGRFASHIATGSPQSVRIGYTGRIAGMNTALLRNSALAGVLQRALSSHVNFVNALQLAAQRGVAVSESHAGMPAAVEGIRVDFETSAGVTSVSGAVVLGRARLLEVNGIRVEVPLAGRLIYMSNFDVPGVIGHVGSVLGKNDVNIANFSLGREERTSASGEALRAVAVVEVDSIIEEKVLNELRSHAAVRFVSVVEL